METIERNRGLRTRFMEGLYEEVGGVEGIPCGISKVGDRMGLRFRNDNDLNELLDTGQYLHHHGLLRMVGGGMMVALTHKGAVAVEAALSQPEQPTDYLGPVNNTTIGTMIGSQVQQVAPEPSKTSTT